MLFCFFFFKDTATTEIYTYWHTLSLHDALPILTGPARAKGWTLGRMLARSTMRSQIILICDRMSYVRETGGIVSMVQSRRSEEHTSELQSLMRISYAVFCLKKKNKHKTKNLTVYTHEQNVITYTRVHRQI